MVRKPELNTSIYFLAPLCSQKAWGLVGASMENLIKLILFLLTLGILQDSISFCIPPKTLATVVIKT